MKNIKILSRNHPQEKQPVKNPRSTVIYKKQPIIIFCTYLNHESTQGAQIHHLQTSYSKLKFALTCLSGKSEVTLVTLLTIFILM